VNAPSGARVQARRAALTTVTAAREIASRFLDARDPSALTSAQLVHSVCVPPTSNGLFRGGNTMAAKKKTKKPAKKRTAKKGKGKK
jgi:hypothetical protein